MNLTRDVLMTLFLALPTSALASDRPPTDAPPTAPASVTAVVVTAPLEVSTTRPAPLMALYAASIALHGFDAYSTIAARGMGGVELNPVMKQFAQNPAALVGVKVLMATATIASAEQLWRRGQRGHADVPPLLSSVSV
jgi:hypothetical protein